MQEHMLEMHHKVRSVLSSSDYLGQNNCGRLAYRRNISNMPTRKHTTAEAEELDRFFHKVIQCMAFLSAKSIILSTIQ